MLTVLAYYYGICISLCNVPFHIDYLELAYLGRKDPMLPGDGITAGNGKDKTCYPGSPEYKFKYGSEGLNTNEIKEYIRNPHKFNIKLEMDGKYLNLWSTDNDRTVPNDDVVIKSVYDPSPVGYSLPASNAFTGFTTTGQNAGDWPNPPFTPEQLAQFNVKFPFDKGWYFYTKKNKKGNTFFFPATGWRYYGSGFVRSNSLSSSYWNAGAENSPYGISLVSYYGDIFPIYASYRNLGFAVRSAEEKIKKHHSLNIPINNFIF